ncbi:hypothetical protein [Halomonas cerina]|uniref:Uncharacterized protein n=1 Tax=Halomonas cerina TaxID=447424 RepID=A0A839V6U2_9GAMM|nr:hypothetical protein [Halomonas cerina]MBB3189670.1 hypothetical protein [Halomonas cerina]
MGDPEHIRTAGHDTRDVPARLPVLFIVFMTVFVPLVLVGLWGLMATLWPALSGPATPFAEEPVSVPDAPPLQASPEADLTALKRRMEQRLQGVGWIDRETGRVYLPIDRAMQLLVEHGLSERGTRANDDSVTPSNVNTSAGPGAGQEAGNE